MAVLFAQGPATDENKISEVPGFQKRGFASKRQNAVGFSGKATDRNRSYPEHEVAHGNHIDGVVACGVGATLA